jgi:glycosyltransferase involved in cell wall biosynthesis
MKYSFIVPTYNSQKWIRQSIGSVLKQTNDKFEIIILDDCSTDGTVEWLRSLNDNRITIYPSEKRLGIVRKLGEDTYRAEKAIHDNTWA